MSVLPGWCSSFLLRVCFDATQLTAPVLGEHPAPVVNGQQRVGVGSIQGSPAIPSRRHETDVQQHLEMLRDGWLFELDRIGDLADRTLFGGDDFEDVAAPSLGDRVERIRGRRGARHASSYIFLYRN